MKLHHPEIRLLSALLNALTTKSGKTTLACLGHVFFTPVSGHTLISASDLDLDFYWPVPLISSVSLPVPNSTAGFPLSAPASCPIDWFLKIASAVRTGGHLELCTDGRFLSAYPSQGPSARSPEPSIPIADAPPFSTSGFSSGGWLSHATLERAAQAFPFISTDETRHVLQGAFITAAGHVVATDGRKLAHSPTRGTQLPRDLILPTRMIKAFEALANGTVDGSAILHGPEHLRMQCWLSSEDAVAQRLLAMHSGCYLRARLIEGNYPNWRQVIPTGFNVMLDIDPEFLAILKITLARAERKKEARVVLDLQPNGTLTAAIRYDKAGSDLIDPVPAGTHTRSPDQPLFAACYNAVFLLHCLTFSGLRLYAIDEISPLRSGDPDSAQTILMPYRLTTAAR